MFWKHSLTARLVVAFLSLSLLAVAVLGALGYRGTRSALKGAALERLEVAAELSEDALEQWVQDQTDGVRMLAAQQSLRQQFAILTAEDCDPARCRDAYAALHDLTSNVLGIKQAWKELLLLDATGKVQIASDMSDERSHFVLERFFTRGQKHTFVQPVYPAQTTGEPTMTVATPVVAPDGRTLGVLAIHLDLSRMDRVLEHQPLEDGSDAYLVDGFNVFVSATRFGRDAHPQGMHSEGIDAAVAGRDDADLYDNYEGLAVVGAYRWIDDLQMAVIVELPQSRVFAPAVQLGGTILGVGLLFALALAIATMLVARQITRPLVSLTDAAVQVADGDLTVVVPSETNDELGLLASAFNRMTHKLQRVYTDLEAEIRERKEIEHNLIDAKEEAERATTAKSDFLAHMSHEIRTPMNGIVGVLQLMGESTTSPEQEEYVRIGQTSATALLTIINDILDFSKIEAGKLVLERIPFDLHNSAVEIRDILGRQAEAKGLDLRIVTTGTMPDAVMGDPGRLRQILLNLVNNAVKFTQSGSVTLRLEVQDTTDGAAMVRVEVEDTGIGMTPEQVTGLFTPFTQADASTTRKFGGTGLGLAIVKRLVAAMDSEIQVSSQLGQGTRFWFNTRFDTAASTHEGDAVDGLDARAQLDLQLSPRPPQLLVSNDQAASAPAPVDSDRIPVTQPGPARILLVDDNAINRKIASRMLALFGHQCDQANNGAQALEALSRRSYDLVLMDCQMPVMDGYQATRAIRERERAQGRRTTIVAMTASATTADRQRSLNASMDDHLSKPIRKHELQALLNQHLKAAPAGVVATDINDTSSQVTATSM